MSKNIYAYTEPTGAGFPGYASLNETDDGKVTLTVRTRGFAGTNIASIEMSEGDLLKFADAIRARKESQEKVD